MSAMAFLAGMGAGYMSQQQKNIENKRQADEDKRKQDAFEMSKTEFTQKQADRTDLQTAAAPAVARAEQGPPTESMVASAALEDRPVEPIGYLSGNGPTARGFATQGAAQTNATAQNTPEAQRGRIAALAAQGNAFAQTALNNDSQNRLHTAQATSAEQTLADTVTAKSIRALPSFDHVGQYISDTPADNQKGSFKGKFVVSPDGTMQTFNMANPDGSFTPTQRTFPNTPQGLEAAKDALAGAMSPEQRRVQAQHEIANNLAAKKEASEADYKSGMLGVARQNANTTEEWRKDQMVNAAAKAAGAGNSGKPVKMDESDRLRMTQAAASVRDSEKMVNEAMKNLQPGDDVNKFPAVAHAQGVLKQAKMSQFKTHVEIGQITPEGVVNDIMGAAKTKGDVYKSLNELSGSVGVEFTDQVAQALKFNDAWISMTPQAQSGQPPKPAAPTNPQAIAATGIAGTPPGAAAAPARGAPALAAQGVQAPKPLSTIDKIQADNIASVAPLAQQYKDATAQFVAAAKSGDQRAVGQYMQAKEALRAQLEKQVSDKFGNNAANVLQKLLSQ